MRVVNLSEQNSVLNQFLREIRDVNIQSDPLRFRRNIERIGEYMAIEVSKTLNYQPTEVQTPLATTTVQTISDQLVLATVFTTIIHCTIIKLSCVPVCPCIRVSSISSIALITLS